MPLTPDHPPFSRRTLLTGSAAAAIGGVAGCSTTGGGTTADDGGPTPPPPGATPTYVPFAGVTPDKPGTAEGVSPVFYNYPTPPIERDGFPLSEGAPFRALMQAGPPNVPPDDNQNYQAMYEQLGCNFEIIYGTYADYTQKFQVLMAGGDIPDLCMITPVAHMPELLESSFTDLTDVLSGDEIKKYPGLANIPTPTWRIGSLNGRLWGVAQPRPPAGIVVNSRGDLLAKLGIDDPNVKLRDGQDLLDLMDQLTDADKNRFAMGADPLTWLMQVTKTMAGAPNVWRVEDGKFTHENETEEMVDALSYAAKIWQAGYLHPNSFSDPKNGVWYTSGVTSLYVQNFVGWGSRDRKNPDWNMGNIELPLWDGSSMAPIRQSQAGYGSYVALKKTDDDKRIEQLLRVADYIASPFGTQQYLDVNYGIEGYSYELDGGNPVKIPKSPALPAMGYFGANSRGVLFGQGAEDSVNAQHDYLSRKIPKGISDPTEGLYSETEVTDAASMAKQLRDVQREVIQGNSPMSDWKDFVKRWKSKVGDKMAGEYAEAAAQQ